MLNLCKCMKLENEKIIAAILNENGVGILPTDTLYGIVGSAFSKDAVEKIYKLRKRNKSKPMIILVGSLSDLKKFDIELERNQQEILKKYWPGKVSVVFECDSEKLDYLHRGKNSLAFRLPDEKWLREFLKKTGPIVAPSANFEGEKPAETIEQAKKYFGDKVDFYVDFGKLKSKPSTIISLTDHAVELIREGAVKI